MMSPELGRGFLLRVHNYSDRGQAACVAAESPAVKKLKWPVLGQYRPLVTFPWLAFFSTGTALENKFIITVTTADKRNERMSLLKSVDFFWT